MNRKTVAGNQIKQRTRERIIRLCFDVDSINNFSPGLKMIYALNDPPLFVKLEETEQGGLHIINH